MHFKRLLGIFGLATTIALGAGFSLDKSNKQDNPIETKADGTTVTLYINQFNGGGNWNNFSYYLFGGSKGENAPFPGVKFTDDIKVETPNELGEWSYKLTINTSEYTTLILAGNPQNWGGSRAQTDNLTISTMPNNGLYCGSQKPSSDHFNVGYYTYSSKTVYLYDIDGKTYKSNHKAYVWKAGNDGPVAWPGATMRKVDGCNNIYSVEINNALNTNRIIFNAGGDSSKTADIENPADGNVYIVYPDHGYNVTTLDAATFIDGYMKFETKWTDDEGDGSCKDAGWYTAAKGAYNSRTEAQRSKILEHEPTQYRLAAWAKANGETLNGSNVLSSSPRINSITITSNNSALPIILVVISIIGITAAGGYYFLKKNKKEEN